MLTDLLPILKTRPQPPVQIADMNHMPIALVKWEGTDNNEMIHEPKIEELLTEGYIQKQQSGQEFTYYKFTKKAIKEFNQPKTSQP